MNISTAELNKLINSKSIIVNGLREHSKASEKYVDVTFVQADGFVWTGSIPYFYRRTGLFIENSLEVLEYLKEIFPLFTQENIQKFQLTERQRWEKEMKGKETTKGFFDKLLNLRWNSVQFDLPPNRNFARRIQDIKEMGYTLSTDTRRLIDGKLMTDTHIQLIPIPKGGVTGYEIMSPTFKAKVIAVLNSINVYELSSANKHGLLPDHKFPEIRWDVATRAENPDNMSETAIKEKFQLLDNQRNQQKREACRKCFQTGQRGKLFGLNYYYRGTDTWDPLYPRVGREAEGGCIGCGWYDIQLWRDSLNTLCNEI